MISSILAKELHKQVPQAQVRLDDAEIDLLPVPHLSLKNLSVVLPGRTLIQIRRLAGYPDLMSLLSGSPRVERIHLQDPKVVLDLQDKPPDWQQSGDTTRLSELLGTLPKLRGEIENGEMEVFGETVLHMEDIHAELEIAERIRLNLRAESNFGRGLNLALESDPQRSRLQGTLRGRELRFELFTPFLPRDIAKWIGSTDIHMASDFSFAGRKDYSAAVRFSPSRIQLTSDNGTGRARLEAGRATISGHARKTRIEMENMDFAEPRASLNGTITLHQADERLSIDLRGNDADVASLAPVLKGLFPEKNFTESFDIVHQGRVPWARITASGRGKEALKADLQILGHLVEGEVTLPEPKMELDRVRGTFHVVKNALSMNDLSARFGRSRITSGRAALGFDDKNEKDDKVDPLSLYLEGRLDLSETSRLVGRTLDNPEFQRQLDRVETLRGRAEATFSFSKKGEDVKWGFDLRELDLEAEHEALPLPVSLSRGGLSYRQETLRFSDLRGRIGTSSIGRLEGEIRFDERPRMQLAGERAEMILNELGPALGELPAAPSWSGKIGLDTLRGRMDLASFSLKGPLQNPKKWDFEAQGSLPELVIAPPMLSEPVQVSAGTLSGTDGNISWTGLTLSQSGSRIQSQGELAFGRKGVQAIRGSATGDIRSPELLNHLYDLVPIPKPFLLRTPLSFSDCRIQWTKDGAYSVRSGFRLAEGTEGDVRMSATPEGYREHLELRQNDRSSTLEASLRDQRLDISFKGALDLGGLRGALRHPGPLHGFLRGDYRISMDISPFRFVESQGVMRVNDLDLPPVIGSPYLRLDRVHLQGRGEEITLHELRVQLNDRPIDVSGSVEITPENNILDLKLRAGELDRKWLKTLQDMGNGGEDSADMEQLSRIRGTVDLRIDAFRLGELEARPVQGIVDVSGNRTTVLIKEVGLCHLDPLGRIVFQENRTSADLSAHVRNRDLAQTIACLGGDNDLVSGEFALSLRTGSTGETPSDLIKGNRGSFRFLAENGRIFRINFLSKILALLNASEILFGNVPDLQEEGFGYNSINVEGRIKGRKLRLKEAIIDGKSLKLAANGDIDFSRMKMDLIVLVSPLKTVDRIISWIPVVNYILQDTLVTIPFRVSGEIGDPTVVPMSPEAVGTEVFGIMKRTLSLPFRIFQPLMPEKQDGDTSR